MSHAPRRDLLQHPAAVVGRLILWPALIEVGASTAARTEADALAAGLVAFATMVALVFVLALVDGLVLRVRQVLLVWSVATVLVALLVSFQPVIDTLVDGDGAAAATEAGRVALVDLPSSVVFFLIMLSVAAGLGVLSGEAIRRSGEPRGDRPAARLPASRG